MLHVLHIGFHLDRERTPEEILNDWWALVATADMVNRSGVRVTVVQACRQPAETVLNGIAYHFIAPIAGRSTIGKAPSFARLIRESRADLFHVHGLGFPDDVSALSELAPATPIFLQDHADRVPRFWRRFASRRGFRSAAGVSFCALRQAAPFARAGLIEAETRLFEIPECSSLFTPGDQAIARNVTGVYGDPALLWVGHLDSNKDPLTVLDGIAAAREQLPGRRLWCCFGQTPLRPEIERRVAADSRLDGRVHLMGKVPHWEVQQLMRAADLFVLGSHREGSGFSVIEALATGLEPVITDIPSFRALTNGGAVGSLWRAGDSSALAAALVSASRGLTKESRMRVRFHFEREISFEAVGRKFHHAYRTLLSRS